VISDLFTGISTPSDKRSRDTGLDAVSDLRLWRWRKERRRTEGVPTDVGLSQDATQTLRYLLALIAEDLLSAVTNTKLKVAASVLPNMTSHFVIAACATRGTSPSHRSDHFQHDVAHLL
jgi:hypothetical protein